MTSKRILPFVFVIVACQLVCQVGRTDEAPEVEKAQRSAPVSLGNGNYFLIARNGLELTLEHVRHDKTTTWKVMPVAAKKVNPSELIRDNVVDEKDEARKLTEEWPLEIKQGRITQITLTRWSRDSLLAAVKVSRSEESIFWCLEFKHVARSNKENNTLTPSAVVVTKGTPEDRVLALSGNVNSPAITIVTGRLSKVRPNVILAGTIAFEWCGLPEFAEVGKFTPKYRRNEERP